jgi:O-antigen/teichoic acid export membrane protein
LKPKNLDSGLYGSAAWIFVSRLLVTLSLVVGTYLFAHQLHPQIYGHYQNFWMQFNTLYAFAGMGIASFIYSYAPEKVIQIFKNLNWQRWVFGTGVLLSCSFIFAWLQEASGISFIWTALFLVTNTLSIFAESFLTVMKRYKFLVGINLLYFLGFVAWHYFNLRQETFNLNLLFAGLTIISSIKTISSSIIIANATKQAAITNLEDKKFLRLWSHLYIFDLIQTLFLYADKFVISLVTTAATSAIYQNGTYPIPFIPILFTAVSSAALVRFAEAQKDVKAEITILKNTAVALSTVVFPIFFLLMVFSKEFIVTFFSEKYLAAIPIFRMSLLALPFKTFNFTVLLQKREMGAVINKGMIVDIIIIALTLYPLYIGLGLKGIPLSFALGTLCQAAYYLYHHKRVLGVAIDKILPWRNWLLKAVIFGCLSLSSGMIIGLVSAAFLYREIKQSRQ